MSARHVFVVEIRRTPLGNWLPTVGVFRYRKAAYADAAVWMKNNPRCWFRVRKYVPEKP